MEHLATFAAHSQTMQQPETGLDLPIVVLGGTWKAEAEPGKQAVRHLAGDRPVIWLELPTLRDFTKGAKKPAGSWKRSLKRLRKSVDELFASQVRRGVEGNTTVISPRYISVTGQAFDWSMNRKKAEKLLLKVLQEEGIDRALIWVAQPNAAALLDGLPDWPLVYYCNFDVDVLDGSARDRADYQERRLTDDSLLVVATEIALAEKFDTDHVFPLPLGLDVSHFARPMKRPADMPQAKRLAGFFGPLNDAVDFQMLNEAAFNLSYWKFILIGPVEVELRGLRKAENVIFLGEKSPHEIPAYVQHWNVSLLPFKPKAQRRAADAMRLQEFMAAGTPIAAGSPFPTLRDYADLVHIAPGRMHLADAIVAAEKEGRSRAARRQARVSSDVWLQMANELTQRLRGLLAG